MEKKEKKEVAQDGAKNVKVLSFVIECDDNGNPTGVDITRKNINIIEEYGILTYQLMSALIQPALSQTFEEYMNNAEKRMAQSVESLIGLASMDKENIGLKGN